MIFEQPWKTEMKKESKKISENFLIKVWREKKKKSADDGKV